MSTSIVLDQTGDLSRRELFAFSRLYPFPAYVKQASVTELLEPSPEQNSRGYADVRRRQFPCFSKAATWLSWAYFLQHRPQLHEKIAEWIEQRLESFTDYWAIRGDVQALREKHAALQQEQRPDQDYMLVWLGENGVMQREYPLRNPSEVKQAAAWFLQYRDHYPYGDRRTMAEKLLAKTAEYNLRLDDVTAEQLEKQAGHGFCSAKWAAECLRDRLRAADPPAELRERINKLAETLERQPELLKSADNRTKLCEALDAYDRMLRLAGQYSEQLPRPEDVFQPASLKEARAIMDDCCTLVTGDVYRTSELARIPLRELRDTFGAKLAAEATEDALTVTPEKLACLAATLPRGDARLFRDVAAQWGVRPFLKAATADPAPSFQDLQQLAALRSPALA